MNLPLPFIFPLYSFHSLLSPPSIICSCFTFCKYTFHFEARGTALFSDQPSFLLRRMLLSHRLSSFLTRAIRTRNIMTDSYISVRPDGAAVSTSKAASATTQLWKNSRANDKSGETRTFFLEGGEAVVAVSTGKELPVGKGDKYENKLRELSRRNVRNQLIQLCLEKDANLDPDCFVVVQTGSTSYACSKEGALQVLRYRSPPLRSRRRHRIYSRELRLESQVYLRRERIVGTCRDQLFEDR